MQASLLSSYIISWKAIWIFLGDRWWTGRQKDDTLPLVCVCRVILLWIMHEHSLVVHSDSLPSYFLYVHYKIWKYSLLFYYTPLLCLLTTFCFPLPYVEYYIGLIPRLSWRDERACEPLHVHMPILPRKHGKPEISVKLIVGQKGE